VNELINRDNSQNLTPLAEWLRSFISRTDSKILIGYKKLFLLLRVLMIVYHKRSEEAKFDLKNLLKIASYYFIFNETCETEYLIKPN